MHIFGFVGFEWCDDEEEGWIGGVIWSLGWWFSHVGEIDIGDFRTKMGDLWTQRHCLKGRLGSLLRERGIVLPIRTGQSTRARSRRRAPNWVC